MGFPSGSLGTRTPHDYPSTTGASFRGSWMVKVVPWPGVLSTRMAPPCSGDDALADGQPQAGPLVLGGEIGLKNIGRHLRRHTFAGIGEADFGVGPLDPAGDGDLPASGHGLQGVFQEIDQHLMHLLGVEIHGRQRRLLHPAHL